jgi:hypothetical protein
MIQPEVPPDQQVLPKIPIPQAMVWTSGEIARRKIVPPTPQTPGAIPVKPSLEKPNKELNLAEMPLTSMPYVTQAPMPVPATTSPVKMAGPVPAKQLPQTMSPDTDKATAARVISLSQQKLQQGTAALPVVNEIEEAEASGTPTLGQSDGVSVIGDDRADSQQDGAGAGHGAGSGGDRADGIAVDDGSSGGSVGDSGGGYSIAGDSENNPDSPMGEGESPAEHILLPKSGQYGMVVVGASPEESYSQTANLWTGRLVYTVYLQTETAQNWILQYSLLHPIGSSNSGSSDPGRPDAPWPYDMMRPNLGYKDIVLVHGFVSAAGRFEQLSVAYPPKFARTAMLLHALKLWEFRPAMNQGQPAAVEVLLIIPGEAD